MSLAVETPAAEEPRAFHGWWIVFAGAVLQALGPGLLGIYGFVTNPIAAEFGASDAQVGLGMSVALLGMTLANPLIGPLFDRGPIRTLMLAGIALMFASLVALAKASALWQLAVGLFSAFIGIALYGALPVQVLLIRWFIERRGIALALAGAGFSVGTFLLPPLAAWLVTHYGWRTTVAVTAAIAACIAIPIVAWLVVPRPEDRGQIPDGRPPSRRDKGDMRASMQELPNAEILRDRNFWLVGLGIGFGMGVPIATLFLVRHMESFGVGAERAALVYVAGGVAGLTGKLLTGRLSDRFDERLVTLAALSCLLMGWTAFAATTTFKGTLLAAVPAGLGAGGMIPMHAILVGACFGRNMAGRILGMQAPLGLPFLLSIPALVGWARDRTGSFEAPFLGLAGLICVSMLLISFLRIPRSVPREGDSQSVEPSPELEPTRRRH